MIERIVDMTDAAWGAEYNDRPARDEGSRTLTSAYKQRFESVQQLSGQHLRIRVSLSSIVFVGSDDATLCHAQVGMLGIKKVDTGEAAYRVKGRFLLAGTSRFIRDSDAEVVLSVKKSGPNRIALGDGSSIGWVSHGSSAQNGVSVFWVEGGTTALLVATHPLFVVNPTVELSTRLLCLMPHLWFLHKDRWRLSA